MTKRTSFSETTGTQFICKDHTVSGESFQLIKDEEYDLLKTFPQPSEDELPAYYKSEKYISHTDSKSSVFDKAYQQVKKYMLNKKISWIEEEQQQKGKILDIGAGTGDFLKRAKSRGWDSYGAEPNSQARALARQKGLELTESSTAFKEENFDVITLWHVLEHVPNLTEQIEEVKRLLRRDGLLVIAAPNFKSYDAEYYKEYWAAYDVPRHLYHFSRNSIEKIFFQNGFHLVSTKPLLFDSFYVSLLSENYKTGQTNFIRGFFTGLLSNLKAKKSGEFSSLTYFLRKN